MNCEFPRWEGLRLFGIDYHGASLDIIADQQVDNLHFELSYRYWRVVFVIQILYLNLSWLLAMQGTVVKVRKVKGILILIQVFSSRTPCSSLTLISGTKECEDKTTHGNRIRQRTVHNQTQIKSFYSHDSFIWAIANNISKITSITFSSTVYNTDLEQFWISSSKLEKKTLRWRAHATEPQDHWVSFTLISRRYWSMFDILISLCTLQGGFCKNEVKLIDSSCFIEIVCAKNLFPQPIPQLIRPARLYRPSLS